MFKGQQGKGNLIKIMGIVLACMAVLIIGRMVIFSKVTPAPETGEAVVTVIEANKLDIPEIDQNDCKDYSIIINDGKPFFTEDEIQKAASTGYFIELSDLDPIKRAQAAVMCADEAHIMSDERESDLSDLRPTGWHVNGIYERSHLLMWKLSGPDVLENIITGTEYFNQVEMLEHEKLVTKYLWDNPGNHVLYRVTPYYVGDELVARGVLMEAYSIEDEGVLSMCEFVYNAQPGSEVVYSTGAYHMYEPWQERQTD